MKILKHFFTITHHRHLVMKYCFKAGIGFQGLFHDLSKYSFKEFFTSAKYYKGDKSPTEYEREKIGYSTVWMHHKGRNKHHFEYWTDLDKNKKIYIAHPMPVRYVKEMLCDRIAASKTYLKDKYTDGSPYEYFISHAGKYNMNKETADLIESWLIMLKEKGEKETFKYIKKIKNK
ncbi:catalase [bacterium]|nr:catalase [bacterium]